MQAGGAAPRSLHSVPTSPTTDTGLSTLQRLIRRMNCDLDLQATLDAVVQGVVDDLGFQVAVVNLVRPDGDLEVVAVAGSDEAIAQLHGQRGPRADWDALLAVADPIGELRFVDHRSTAWRHDDAIPTWVPQVGESDDEDAWHADDALFAPLTSISDGLIGVLSVDLPVGGRRPGAEQLELLEMFAAQAQLAIENARLLAAVEAARKADTAVLLARLRAVFDAAPVAVVELDLQDRVHLWNPAAERLFGWTAAEVLGRPMRTVPATGADDHTVVMGRLASGEDVSPREVLRQRKDGSLVAVEVSKALLRNSQGAVTGVLAIMADVTERQALQHRLQARAKQQAAVAELGQRALAGGDLSELFQTACAVVAQTLEVDVVTLHQRGPHGDRLLVRAGLAPATWWASCRTRRSPTPARRRTPPTPESRSWSTTSPPTGASRHRSCGTAGSSAVSACWWVRGSNPGGFLPPTPSDRVGSPTTTSTTCRTWRTSWPPRWIAAGSRTRFGIRRCTTH